LISTAVTWVPQGSGVAVDDVLDLQVDAGGVGQKLIEA